ncbi:MAG: DinB family protein [Gemmatimonadaceae bacterium]|nr:DinB family protein [Gemmatimonadaceae bacterium]
MTATPPISTGKRLAAELRRAWHGAPWHGPSVLEIVGRLTAAEAATRTARGSHTPWQIVLHLTTWVEAPRRRLDDPSFDPREHEDFPVPTALDAQAWARDVEALGVAIERLAAQVESMSDEVLAAPVGARPYTHTTMLDGVVQHLAYHAGQVALLARPDAGSDRPS